MMGTLTKMVVLGRKGRKDKIDFQGAVMLYPDYKINCEGRKRKFASF